MSIVSESIFHMTLADILSIESIINNKKNIMDIDFDKNVETMAKITYFGVLD